MVGRMLTDEARKKAVVAAAKANRRRKANRLAAELREQGWTVIPPEEVDTRDLPQAA